MKSGPRGGGNVAIRIQSGLSAQARLDGVLADVAEAQERLMVARQADEELKAELDRDLTERRFFFSSRRRHTRFDCDWSSDVCSSDLAACGCGAARASARPLARAIAGGMTNQSSGAPLRFSCSAVKL